MNLALPAVLLLALILPGLILVSGYQGRFGSSFKGQRVVDLGPMSVDWFAALAMSPLLHWCWIEISEAVSSLRVDLRAVVVLLSGTNDAGMMSGAIAAAADHWGAVTLYFTTLYATAAVVGVGLHQLVRWSEFDRKVGFLRLNNEWHYLFSGELHDSDPRPDGALVTAAVESEAGAYLYAGLLASFSYGRDGDLSKIELSGAVRRRLRADRAQGEEQQPLGEDKRWYPIEGQRLVLWRADIKTLNVRYYRETDTGIELL